MKNKVVIAHSCSQKDVMEAGKNGARVHVPSGSATWIIDGKKLLLMFVLLVAPVCFGQTTHSATISFTVSPDTPTSNVYRADGTCPLTPPPSGQTKLNLTPISGTSYTDSTVSAAKTYCYTVKAVLNGLESKDSNMVTATVPLAPASSVTVVTQ